MKNTKILILLILFLQIICCTGFAQCNQGRQESMDNTGKNQVSSEVANKDIGSEAPIDPNEIIGLEGYNAPESTDMLWWVSAAQTLAYTVYFENDPELAMAAASKIPLAHCVRGGMVRGADGRVGKRRAASENVPLPVTSSSPPFFFPFCLQARHTIPRNVTTLSGISSDWQTNLQKVLSDLNL